MTDTLKAPEAVESCQGAVEINQDNHITEHWDCAISEENLLEFIYLHTRFKRLYRNTGLVATDNSDGIHLTEEAFLATFEKYETADRSPSDYPEELFAYFNGVRFFAIR